MYNGNPIVRNERIFIEEDGHIDVRQLFDNQQSAKTSSVEEVWGFINRVVSCLKVYLLSLLGNCSRHNPFLYKQSLEKNVQQTKMLNNESKSNDISDIEIISKQDFITNDYHLVNKQTSPRLRENSILVDYDGDGFGDGFGFGDGGNWTLSSSEHDRHDEMQNVGRALRGMAIKRLQSNAKPVSSQYGTDFSIAKPIQYNLPAATVLSNMVKATTASSNMVKATSTASSSIGQFGIPPKPITKYQESVLNYYAHTKLLSTTSPSILDTLISNIRKEKITSTFEQTQAKIQDLITKKRLETSTTTTAVQKLTDEQLKQVYQAWESNPRKLYVVKYSIELVAGDIQTLKDNRWLNDNAIDFYINLIMQEIPRIFGWTTHFYTTLEERGYKGVERWAKRKKLDLFTMEKILVPVNIHNTHWALAVIDNKEKSIVYYDSLDGSGRGNIEAVSNLQMYMDKEAQRLGRDSITYKLVPSRKAPQQRNGTDCGVFTLVAARYIAENKELNYSQTDMKTLRRRIVYEMLNNLLLK
ncbi:hypothetical protein KGF56_003411 [Candida oxycetoniae]|uniref:Ubiquitin-like protease family profile domain-containing protein n=1 Tax=Candida oxycetoniae TaxID=497107 RepID=A0AAI9WWZ6_9ASCO|nr:uncharacterized protein KGF56_003411 [Candida oxycetoniae]KAI3403776.2 hypothetical protein KGF56_003411 [Candida oxycetoniae]